MYSNLSYFSHLFHNVLVMEYRNPLLTLYNVWVMDFYTPLPTHCQFEVPEKLKKWHQEVELASVQPQDANSQPPDATFWNFKLASGGWV